MSEYYAVVRSTDHLAHYGVKGMKWGVRRALSTGNEKALDRHFRRAAKKLKKLTDISLNSKKYAAKAAAYGAAAAGTGTVAALGTGGYAALLRRKASGLFDSATASQAAASKTGEFVYNRSAGTKQFTGSARRMAEESEKLHGKANQIEKWGNKRKKVSTSSTKKTVNADGTVTYKHIKGPDTETGLSRNQKLRIAAGAATVGLGAMSALNAYRASHPDKYRAKAVKFKNTMDDVFAGTQYSGQYVATPRKRRKRR